MPAAGASPSRTEESAGLGAEAQFPASGGRIPGEQAAPAEASAQPLVLTGIGVGSTVAEGPILHLRAPEDVVAVRPTGSAEQEAERASAALAEVAAELNRRARLARERGGGAAADILEAQAMMVEDPGLAEAVAARTQAGTPAPRAIVESFGEYRALLAEAGPYLAARVGDLDDLAARAAAAAQGVPMPGVPVSDEPFVLVARDLAPADTALLDLDQVRALVTEQGGPTSHTAIIARSRGIPAVVGAAGALELAEGTRVLVDPAEGRLIASPTAALLATAHARAEERARGRLARGPGRTADGVAVSLLANIAGPDDIAAAVDAGAEGVGLMRTEFLYLGSTAAPAFEEQVDAYRRVLDAFPGRRVIVRTLDAGADKPLAFMPLGAEENPALGVRGLRALRGEYGHLLDTQLSALAAAQHASEGRLAVMAPMVADEVDAAWFAGRARAHGLAEVGVMIEVPSAALRADALLGAVDFASLGTNDLTQYTLAADRQSAALGALQDPWHPAVLALIAMAARAGAAHGKPVGVCGEAAGDPRLALVLVGLGATSLSMAPSALPEVRGALAAHTFAACQELAAEALHHAAPRPRAI